MTTTLTPNIPLLRKVLEQIDAHPELHDQGSFDATAYDDRSNACGTSHCVAGWAIVLSDGYRYDPKRQQFLDAAGEVIYAEGVAEQLLGITDLQGWSRREFPGVEAGLFSCQASREDIQRIAEQLAEIAGEEL